MPPKARYWSNPEHHRAEVRNRIAKRTAQGLPWRFQISPAAEAHRKKKQMEYHAAHRDKQAAASRKMRKRMKKLFGSSGHQAQWLYHLHTEAAKLAKKKERARDLWS